jgi:hypothetical protein
MTVLQMMRIKIPIVTNVRELSLNSYLRKITLTSGKAGLKVDFRLPMS